MNELLVGEYLLKRVQELGIKSIFGVPGDFELAFLDLILATTPEPLEWHGTPNELIASYAADGYARVHGAAALVTTFGPGETSALCGIAGAYTEFVPVVHIVGYPSMKAQRSHAILHHTLGEGKFHNYHEMSKQISCATTVLEDSGTAASEIDRVLNAMLLHSQPVYIGIPTDIAFEKIRDDGLLVPLVRELDPNPDALERKILGDILAKVKDAKDPIIMVDGGATRHGVLKEVEELVEATGFPVYTSPMGKGAVNEKSDRYAGVYAGAGSKADVKEAVEAADLVLWIGNYPADLNTGEFTQKVSQSVIIDFQRFYITFGAQKYNLKMKHLLPKLITSIKSLEHARTHDKITPKSTPYNNPPSKPKDDTIIQAWFWPTLSRFLRTDDLIVVETGTPANGFAMTQLPGPVTVWTQEVFGSIGYATGAIVGAAVAHKQRGGKRCILITGEGSLQMTVQALSELLRSGVNAHLFVINNDGYTVERMIHGADQPYNDLAQWKYTAALDFFGPGVKHESFLVKTPSDWEKLLDDEAFGEPRCTKLIEIVIDKLDAPESLKKAGPMIDAFNAGKL